LLLLISDIIKRAGATLVIIRPAALMSNNDIGQLTNRDKQHGPGVPGLGTMEQLYFDVNGSAIRRIVSRMMLMTSLLQLGWLCVQSLTQE